MPAVMANALRDGIRRVTGTLLLIVVAVAWLSLVSWSIQDPSLSHATSQPARNWLGTHGAIGSDLLVQTFGLASLIVLLAPMFWGLALIQREPVPRLGLRVWAYVTAVFALAAAASALPQPLNWPLHHSLGGIIGGAAFRVLSAPFAAVHPEFGRLVAAAVFLAIGVWSAVLSLAVACRGRTRANVPVENATIRNTRKPSARVAQQAPPEDRIPPVLAENPIQSTPAHWQPTAAPSAPVDARLQSQYGPYAALEPVVDDEPIDLDFEVWTSATSSGMAARFAPTQTATPRALQDHVSEVFTGEPRLSDTLGYAVQDVPPTAQPRTGSVTGQSRPPTYKRPSLNLLQRAGGSRAKPTYTAHMLRGNARFLEDVLADFGVIGEIRDIVPGPVVTIYELEHAPTLNTGRVIALADDIARGMTVTSVRISPIPGRHALGIAMPNQVRELVTLRDVFDAEIYRSTMDILPVALGRSVTGAPVVADLARIPHMLVGGANGAGKSVGLNAMILSLLYKHGPDDCRFLMIDPKMLDLAAYNGIPHLLTPVVTDPHKAITALAWCVTEMEERYKRLAALGVSKIDVFNNRVRNAKKRGEPLGRTVQTGFNNRTGEAMYEKEELSLEPMPYIVIVMDEFADLMAVAGREIEGAVQRLCVPAKAVGIHLIMATERPTSDIVTGPMKAGLAARVSYKAASKNDSRAVIGSDGAEQLLGAGDMLYANGTGQLQRVHGPYVSSEEIESVANSLRQQEGPRYIDGIVGKSGDVATEQSAAVMASSRSQRVAFAATSEDALYDRAVAIVVRDRRASLSFLQRRLNVSPSWAASLLQRLERDGVIGQADAHGHFEVLVDAAA